MAELIRLIEETEVEDVPTPQGSAAPAAAPVIDPQIVAAIQNLAARLTTAEGVIQSVPKVAGTIRTLTRALGARALMFVALIGCLGLAGAVAYQPSWQGLGIFVSFAVLTYLPLAYLASRGN